MILMVGARVRGLLWRRARLPSTSTTEQIVAMRAIGTPRRHWTLEQFYRERDAGPPGMRYELVDGELLMTPSPHWSHQRIALELTVVLRAYVKQHDLGEVFVSPLDVLLEPDLVLQRDVLVVPAGELRK